MPGTHLSRPSLRIVGLAVLLAFAAPATAGISYRLDRPSAAPGTTIHIEALFVNEGTDGAHWQPPAKLVLQWRDTAGTIVRSLADAVDPKLDVNVPVNNFARASWTAVVPNNVHGLQAVSVEGEPALMALDATSTGTVAGTPANVPIENARTGQPVPPVEARAVGASPETGPAPAQVAAAQSVPAKTAFDSFRDSLSEYQPVYFDVSTRGRTTARFQLSFKYRLFTPDPGKQPTFWDHLYLGYTQTSLWDLQGDSKPFIDTTFNPSLFWLSDNVWNSKDQNWRLGLSSGVEHASNGKAGDDSRSVNDAFVQPALNYRFNSGSTLSFAPKIKAYFGLTSDENPDYADYAGYVDWNLKWAQDGGLVASAMYRQGASSHRTTQLDLAYPLKRIGLNMNGYLHLQYFNGYGETLLGYNQRYKSQLGVGISFVP